MSGVEIGNRCIVIAEKCDCLCNIGAQLTVVGVVPQEEWSNPLEPEWLFADASRPLKMAEVEDRTDFLYCRASEEAKDCWAFIEDRYLLPIRDPDEDESDGESERISHIKHVLACMFIGE